MLDKLEILRRKGLVDSAFFNIKKWLENKEFAQYRDEIMVLIESENVNELNDSFFKMIPIGTAGRRGKMGVGDNRINAHTISESAQGFVQYLIEYFGVEEVKKRGFVITYDVRHNSRLFAEAVAGVFAGNGVKTYFFDGVRSTPQLSFSIRYLRAVGGAMISASHNFPSDNGIKLFWENGGQIVPPDDEEIIKRVKDVKKIKCLDFASAVDYGLAVIPDEEVDRAYHDAAAKLSLGDFRGASVVFTPLHGCASTSFLPVLRRVGFKNIFEVKEQMPFDPEFSRVAKQTPNPEVPISLDLAIKYAKEKQADLVLASDPDADRIGVVSRENYKSDNYIFLNGNQIGVLLFDYIISRLKKQNALPKNGVMIKTVVTTDLLTKIAQDNGIETITDLPVGFKYIADAIDHRLGGRQFLFGAEESHGYLYGDYARDKDGAIAALLICEYASLLKEQGKTLFEQLESIKKKYGYYRELLQDIYYPGMDGMDKMTRIMRTLRAKLPTHVDGIEVLVVFDQLNKKFIDPKSGKQVGEYSGFTNDALVFYLNKEKTERVVVRPSGTQPKIKFYVAIGQEVGENKSSEEYLAIKKSVDAKAFKTLKEFVKTAEEISPGGEKFEVLG